MFNLAGHLYGADFYRELYRVLDKRGRLFHYIANPDSKSGATITRGVMRRLEEVGFQRVTRRPEAFGVIAFK
jgi:predicted methyltransferase